MGTHYHVDEVIEDTVRLSARRDISYRRVFRNPQHSQVHGEHTQLGGNISHCRTSCCCAVRNCGAGIFCGHAKTSPLWLRNADSVHPKRGCADPCFLPAWYSARGGQPMAIKQITCPDCGLVLRVRKEGAGFKFNYAIRKWKRRCKRQDLGDPLWCLLQRKGTSTRRISRSARVGWRCSHAKLVRALLLGLHVGLHVSLAKYMANTICPSGVPCGIRSRIHTRALSGNLENG